MLYTIELPYLISGLILPQSHVKIFAVYALMKRDLDIKIHHCTELFLDL